ncbi:DUF2849 domain-containing protein [Methylobrevis pamukkalensis]|nr:DUF2849 domain-containing protein [Methylobrevis pamukkalensis]
MQQILTGNHLVTGDVVFRTASGDWSVHVDEAGVLEDKAAVEAALAAAAEDVARCVLVGVEAIDVVVAEGRVVPKRLRERIRADGPTVKSDYRPDLRPVT